MSRQDVTIPMPDGEARAYVFTPDQGQGPWPTVLFYMDGPGIRPALFEMGERLANHGYYVLLPDMFWRLGPYPPMVPGDLLKNEELRRELFSKFLASTDAARSMADTKVFFDWLDRQPKAKAGKVGTTGYCMGARMSLRAAGTFPDRVAAAGCFHGSGLATDEADSPHRLASRMKGKILVAGGDEDEGFDDAQCERLAKALKDAGVNAEVTIYRGARHGYAPPDMPVYDRDASERHWREMLALFDETLKTPAMA
jgi:carboxymethylenebutenolidase